jgi:DNA-binding transcriptional ArsR family regulator
MRREEVIAALGALAQESRLDIFRMLVQKGPDAVAAGDIARKLDLPAPTLSFHLGQLKHAGLLSAHRHSRSISYAVNFRTMNALLKYLTENCCQGQAELCAPANVNGSGTRQPARAARKTTRTQKMEVSR